MQPEAARPASVTLFARLVGGAAALALAACWVLLPNALPSILRYGANGAWLLVALVVFVILAIGWGSASLWRGSRVGWWVLLVVSAGLLVFSAAALLSGKTNIPAFALLPLLAASLGAALFAPSVRTWASRGAEGPAWPTQAWLLAGGIGAGWVLAAWPLASLYTRANGATLARDASIGIVAGAALIAAVLSFRRERSLAPVAAGIALALPFGLAMAAHAERLAVAPMASGIVFGEETFLYAAGAALAIGASAAAFLLARGVRVDAVRAAVGIAFGGAAIIAGLSMLANRARLVALAQQRHDTPALGLVATLGLALLVAFAGRRMARR